jgi:hypothetical protein
MQLFTKESAGCSDQTRRHKKQLKKRNLKTRPTAGMVAKLILIDGLVLITNMFICAGVVRHWNDVNF